MKRWYLFVLGALVGAACVWFAQRALLHDRVGWVIYLAPTSAPEIWKVRPDGSDATQLTRTGGKVFDYAVWPDDGQVVYSARNAVGGLDLWLMKAGGASIPLLECGADHCAQPAVSPDGKKIAYTRRNQGENPGGDAVLPRVWIYTLEQGQTSPLFADARIDGAWPQWRPDGRALAFYRLREEAIQIHHLDDSADLLLPAQNIGPSVFMPDSSAILFAQLLPGEELPVGRLSKYSFQTGQTATVLEGLDITYFSAPAVSPAGDWLAVAGIAARNGSASPLWVARIDGSQNLAVNEDAQLSQGGYRWDAAGQRLVYQQYKLGGGDLAPEVYTWDLATRVVTLVARDAFAPGWMP